MNIQALMKQAQSMQKDMLKAKEEIDKMTFIGKSSLVEVEVDGTKKVLKININDKESISVEDLEMLEDMLVVAINSAFSQVDDITAKKMGKFANMPGIF
ncbi:MAG: YbaB/EbfC family nucleoid-associated protein [Bacilli bacterium]